MDNYGVKIDGLDLIEVVNFIQKKNRRYQAMLLNDLEEILGDNENFYLVRKTVLDSFNDYTRSLQRLLFGNIEDNSK